LNQLTLTENFLREINGQQSGGTRKRRAVFKFMGEVSKILFGTMDENDAQY
jgi:Fe-S cluster assembly ATPase SufC